MATRPHRFAPCFLIFQVVENLFFLASTEEGFTEKVIGYGMRVRMVEREYIYGCISFCFKGIERIGITRQPIIQYFQDFCAIFLFYFSPPPPPPSDPTSVNHACSGPKGKK